MAFELLAAADPPVPLWAMELSASLFLYAWLFCVGASVGSFLNVVVYRLPRGLSLVHPGSFCPACGHGIRLRDNIPLLGWLALGGRCRDCRAPIAARYFWVELAVAMLFLAVALVETRLTGSFPRRNWDPARWLITPYETVPFWSTYALHVSYLTTLLGAALIERDGCRVPAALFFPVLVGAGAAAVFAPDGGRLAGLSHAAGWQGGPPAALLGAATGLALGAAAAFAWNAASRARGRQDPRPALAPLALFVTTGALLGWRGLLLSAAAASVLWALGMFAQRMSHSQRGWPLAGAFFVATAPLILDLDIRLEWQAVALLMKQTAVLAGCAVATLATFGMAAWLAPFREVITELPVAPPPVNPETADPAVPPDTINDLGQSTPPSAPPSPSDPSPP